MVLSKSEGGGGSNISNNIEIRDYLDQTWRRKGIQNVPKLSQMGTFADYVEKLHYLWVQLHQKLIVIETNH